MWRQALAHGVLCLLSVEYSSNMRGLAGNLSDLTVASSQYDILFCSETLVSDMLHVTAYVRDGYGACRQPKFECGCCEMLFRGIWGAGVRQNLYVHSLYRNPDLDDQIFDCLLASMAAVQAEDVRASFLFVSDLNGHHQE